MELPRLPTILEQDRVLWYNWDQTDSEVIFKVQLPSSGETPWQSKLSVKIEPSTLWVGCSEQPSIIKGKLYGSVNQGQSSWGVKFGEEEGTQLVICLIKDVKGSQWPVAVTGGLKLREDTDPSSAFFLGQLTEGVLPAKTLELYTKSAHQGHLLAQQRLARLYEAGHSIMVPNPDLAQALKYYELAAHQDSSAGLLYCGNWHFHSKAFPMALAYYFRLIDVCKLRPLPPTSTVKNFKQGVPVFSSEDIAKDYNSGILTSYVATCYLVGTILADHPAYETDNCTRHTMWTEAAAYNYPPACYDLAKLFHFGASPTFAVDLNRAATHYHHAHSLDPELYPIPQGIPNLLTNPSQPATPMPDQPSKRNDTPPSASPQLPPVAAPIDIEKVIVPSHTNQHPLLLFGSGGGLLLVLGYFMYRRYAK